MGKSVTRIFIFLLLILNISCDKNVITDPAEQDNAIPGSRNYTWTVDTLNIPMNMLSRLWGTSPTDIWATGQGGGLDKTIHHFDGSKWYCDNISRLLVPKSIFGFGTNDVWIGGENYFWHYNGTQWSFYSKFTIEGYDITGIESLWGRSPNNIYALGYAYNSASSERMGILFNYNGIEWSRQYIPYFQGSFIKMIGANDGSNLYYILGIEFNSLSGGTDVLTIFEFNGRSSKAIYSGKLTTDESANVEVVGDQIFILQGRDIYTRNDGKLKFFYHVNEPNYVNALMGRSKKDIFLCMNDGFAHYNGTDVKYLYKFSNNFTRITGNLIFQKDVIFMAYDFVSNINLIIRGKLND